MCYALVEKNDGVCSKFEANANLVLLCFFGVLWSKHVLIRLGELFTEVGVIELE